MQELTRFVVRLPAADHELTLLHGDVELVAGEARYRKRDAQPFRIAAVARQSFDVVRRITVGALGNAVEQTLDLIEAQQEWAGERRNTCHGLKALEEATLTGSAMGTPRTGTSGPGQ